MVKPKSQVPKILLSYLSGFLMNVAAPALGAAFFGYSGLYFMLFFAVRATEKITCKNWQILYPAFTQSVTRRGAGWEHGFYG
jgi:hypothetical protein